MTLSDHLDKTMLERAKEPWYRKHTSLDGSQVWYGLVTLVNAQGTNRIISAKTIHGETLPPCIFIIN